MSTPIPPNIQRLMDRYLDGTATAAELDLLDEWYHSRDNESVAVSEPETREIVRARIKSRMMASLAKENTGSIRQVTPSKPFYPAMFRTVAAVILLVLVGYFVNNRINPPGATDPGTIHFSKADDIPSPGPSAYLVREDNSTLDLGRIMSGEILAIEGIELSDAGMIRFAAQTDPKDLPEEIEEMRVVVPKGNIFEMVLPDGSKVALNADSRLSFPSRFDGMERHVSLNGEGFFEVEADPDRPFFVHTEQQEIRVTGTQFNVSAYAGERTERTALVEGKVSMRNLQSNEWTSLKPGDEGIVESKGTLIEPYQSLESIIAWKSNIFVFEQESIADILRKVSRWYDVQFEWQALPAAQKSNLFSGKIRKQAGLKEVLTMLSLVAQVDFHQRNEVLIVSHRQ